MGVKSVTTMPEPTDSTDELWRTADDLLCHRLPAGHLPVRLLGMGVIGLDDTGQVQWMLSMARSGRSRARWIAWPTRSWRSSGQGHCGGAAGDPWQAEPACGLRRPRALARGGQRRSVGSWGGGLPGGCRGLHGVSGPIIVPIAVISRPAPGWQMPAPGGKMANTSCCQPIVNVEPAAA